MTKIITKWTVFVLFTTIYERKLRVKTIDFNLTSLYILSGDSMKRMGNILEDAKQKKYAIPQFNINNLEWTKNILEACQKENSPVFLGVSTGAVKYMGGYNVVRQMVDGLIRDLGITIPVILHLDHGTSVDECKKAVDANFDSIMIDASHYDLETNIKMTNEVINYAKDQLIEAELGTIGGTEDEVTGNLQFTKLDDAIEFIKNVNIDLLAPSLGSVHGLYKSKPDIQFDLMNQIFNAVNTPLVLHGGTGLSDEIIRKSIRLGICKININTEFQVAWNEAIRDFINKNPNEYDPRKIISSGAAAIRDVATQKIHLLGSNNKG